MMMVDMIIIMVMVIILMTMPGSEHCFWETFPFGAANNMTSKVKLFEQEAWLSFNRVLRFSEKTLD